MGPVVVEARRIDDADAAEQAEGRRRPPAEAARSGRGAVGACDLARRLAGDREQRGGRALAQAEARARLDVLVLDLEHAGPAAARSSQTWRTRAGRSSSEKSAVERRDPVRVRGRDVETLAHVAERPGADPAGATLRGAQRGQEQVSAGARGVAAALGAAVGRHRRPDDGVDRVPLRGPRLERRAAEVHQPAIRST